MPAAPLPDDESARLVALKALSVLDSPPEAEFDALVRVASAFCGVPISLISLVDAQRQWFKANVGLPGVCETPRELAFCAHAILGDAMLDVPDATADARFADNALVTGEPGIRFYAGVPLVLTEGQRVGTLCVIDRQPRRLDQTQQAILRDLAQVAVRALEARRALAVEARTASLLRDSSDAVVSVDRRGRVTFWNRAAERLLGWTPEDRLGAELAAIAVDECDDVLELIHHACASGGVLVYETERRHKSGHRVPVSVTMMPVRREGEGEGADSVVKVLHDLRDKRAHARAAAQHLARFQVLSDTVPVGVFATGADGRTDYVNAHWQQLCGRDGLQGRREGWLAAVHPQDRDRVLARWAESVAGESALAEDFRLLLPDGRERRVRVRAEPLRDPHDFQGHVGALEDVTEVTALLERLSRSEERLRQLYERTPVMMHSIDAQGRIQSVSDRWLERLAYRRDEVVGRPSTDFLTEASRTKALEEVLPKFFETGRCEKVAYQLVASHGGIIDVELYGILERDDAGRPQRSLAVLDDVTARLRAERELMDEQRSLQRALERLDLATDGGGIGIWDLDLRSRRLESNHRMWALIGGREAAGEPMLTVARRRVRPDDMAEVMRQSRAALALRGALDTEVRLHWPDGSFHQLRLVARIVADRRGQPTRMIGAAWDVTAERRLHRELNEQRELLQVTLNSIGDAVITTDAAGRVQWLNPVAERMTGWWSEEARGRALPQVFHIVDEETRRPAENPVRACLVQGRLVGFKQRTVLLARSGEEFGIEDSAAPIRNGAGEVLGAVLVFHDVTEQRRLSGEMNYRATHDLLTGLVNRVEFDTRLRRTFTRAHEDQSSHALLYIDLDQFKLVNDACGHTVGDQLLQQVGRLLTDTIRARDTLARLGGDEFGAILEHCSVEQAQGVAQKICERMEDFRFHHDGRRFRIGTSIGLVPVDKRWASTAAILQAADTACYAAKEAGRNRVHVWFDTDQALHARHGQMRWAARIEQAIDEDRFALFLQRIVPVGAPRSGLHAEVLLRMREPDGSLVVPGAFLPAAERFNLASRLDRWVLRAATRWLDAHPERDRIGMLSINLSGQSIGDRAFHRQAVELFGTLPPDVLRRLCLEVTETAAVTNLSDAAAFIDEVRALGVKIALDDFGAGASSFGYLKSMNVDILKIDGQFIRDLLVDPIDRAAVRCFVEVAKAMDLCTVAEFVEDRAVMDELAHFGIDFAQGHLLHRPQDIALLEFTA